MAYDKEEIDSLFCQYIATGQDDHLEALICACEPLIVTVVSHYDEMFSYHEDIIQEAMVRLWILLCNKERAAQEIECPHSWIYKRVRHALVTTVRQYARQHGMPLRLNGREREVVDMRDGAQKSFEDIAQALNVCVETAKCYYSIAKNKLQAATRTDSDKTLLEQSDNSNLDPAKRYEMKDLHRVWRQKLHSKADAHPSIANSDKARKDFHRFVDDLLGKEIDDIE